MDRRTRRQLSRPRRKLSRPRRMLSAALGASLGVMLLVSLVPSAGATQAAVRAMPSAATTALGLDVATGRSSAASPTALVATLVDRLVASSGLPATQLAARLVAAPRVPGPAPLASAARAKLPPDLIALEQKMRTLHVNSERGSVFVLLTGVNFGSLFKGLTSNGSHHVRVRSRHMRSNGSHHMRVRGRVPRRVHGRKRGHGSERRHAPKRRSKRLGASRALGLLPSFTLDALPLITADFESSVSPKLAIVRAEVLGAIPLQMREIGEQLYLHSPLLAELDGGRPWVYRSPAESAEAKAKEGKAGGEGSALSPLGQPDGAEAGFGKLAALIVGARSVVEVGRRTVDGQATTEFEAKLDSKRLRELLNPSSKREKKGSSKEVKRRSKSSSSKRLTASQRALTPVKATLDLYLAPNGLPVRTVLAVHVGEMTITAGLDIVATEIPISVQPPPASETITKAELKKAIEASSSGPPSEPPLSKRERAEEKRFWHCMNRRLPKRDKRARRRRFVKTAHECERRARLPSQPGKGHSRQSKQ